MTSNHIYDVVISNHDKLFETIKEATEYCDHHNISRATIRQYEHQEEYDEDGLLEEIWNFNDWTYPLKKKKIKKKKKKLKLIIKEEEEDICKTKGCSKFVSKVNWREGNDPRNYCEGCYLEDQEEEEKIMEYGKLIIAKGFAEEFCLFLLSTHGHTPEEGNDKETARANVKAIFEEVLKEEEE